MDPIELYHLLARKPFQPVRVHLNDGRSYDIPMRELAIVGVTDLDIGFQIEGERPGIISTLVTIQLDEIRGVEPLPPVAVPAAT